MEGRVYKHIYKQGEICKNEQEKRERCLASYHRYNVKRYTCIECDREYSLGNRASHLKSKIHLNSKMNKQSLK